VKRHNRYESDIISIRAVEDAIRASRRYTEQLGTMLHKHPVQGEHVASRVLTKHYEVYPETDLDEMLSVSKAIDRLGDWLWGDVPKVVVLFHYDYRSNRAYVIVRDGTEAIDLLAVNIPGFANAIDQIKQPVGVDK